MKKIISLLLLFAFTTMYNPALASVKVPANTSIQISPVETVTSKDSAVDTINCEIIDDVVVDGVTIFKTGAKAQLHIGELEKSKCWGKAGKMTIVNGFAYDVKGEKHKILLNKNCYGEEKTWPKTCGAISIFFLFPLALFGFVHGGEAKLSSSLQLETNLASEFAF